MNGEGFSEVCLRKGEQVFLWRFRDDDSGRDQAARSACQFAANPEIQFSWLDAATAIKKIRGLPVAA